MTTFDESTVGLRSGSSFGRNVEVWRFGASAAIKIVKANKITDVEHGDQGSIKFQQCLQFYVKRSEFIPKREW